MFNVGDIVAVPTDVLFMNYCEEKKDLIYVPREQIYGIVTVRNKTHNIYFMRWAIEKLFDMTEIK